MCAARENRHRKARRVARVLVVDDHPMIRERLAAVVEREPDLTICGDAEDAQGALEAVAKCKPDLAVIDLVLKRSDGLDLIKDLRNRYPDLLILVISMHDETVLAERAIRAGARGYITKQEATRKVLTAIRTVLNGKLYLNESMALGLASKVAQNAALATKSSVDILTDRELRVFQLIGHGRGTRQIAREMGLHITTVETYRARIKEKLNLRGADELRQQAIGWVQLSRGSRTPDKP